MTKNYTAILETYILSKPLTSDKARFGFMIGHTAVVYNYIEYVNNILKEALKEGEIGVVKSEIDRSTSFLDALLRLDVDDADNKSPI